MKTVFIVILLSFPNLALAADVPAASTVTFTADELRAYSDYRETAAVARYATEQARMKAAEILAKVDKTFAPPQPSVEQPAPAPKAEPDGSTVDP